MGKNLKQEYRVNDCTVEPRYNEVLGSTLPDKEKNLDL